MTQDEIIEMARQAASHGVEDHRSGEVSYVFYNEHLTNFANLVAQHERDKWERHATRLQTLMDLRETQPNKPCCLAEREACAKVCDDHCGWTPRMIGSTIRARGQA
jgi:hypothetical protein